MPTFRGPKGTNYQLSRIDGGYWDHRPPKINIYKIAMLKQIFRMKSGNFVSAKYYPQKFAPSLQSS
jgi:hypothetical protein